MEKVRALVQDDLARVEKALSDIVVGENIVFDELKGFVSGNSKRIRSILCLLYLKSNNIIISGDIITIISASELIHNASLLHDDVIDNSSERRGLPTIYNKYGSRLSILLGDYLLSVAVEQILKLNNSNITSIFIQTAKKMCNAEVFQYINRKNDLLIEEYISIAEGKTASLFSAVLKSASLLCGLDELKAENLGRIFGIIFQINNDLDIDSKNNDIKNGVVTPALFLGIEKTLALKDNYKEEFLSNLSDIPENIYKEGIEELIRLL